MMCVHCCITGRRGGRLTRPMTKAKKTLLEQRFACNPSLDKELEELVDLNPRRAVLVDSPRRGSVYIAQ